MALEHILIVDDDEQQHDFYTYPLAEAGYNVLCLADANAAVSYITVTPPDVLVIDYQMPVMTGLEILQHMEAEGIRVRVTIMLTGTHLRTGQDARDIQPYVDLMLAKPFDPVLLRNIIIKFAADHAG